MKTQQELVDAIIKYVSDENRTKDERVSVLENGVGKDDWINLISIAIQYCPVEILIDIYNTVPDVEPTTIDNVEHHYEVMEPMDFESFLNALSIASVEEEKEIKD